MLTSLEYAPCDSCQSRQWKVLYKSTLLPGDLKRKNVLKDFVYASKNKRMSQIVKCEKCGLVFVNPREKNVKRIYEDVEDAFYMKSKEERYTSFRRDLKKIKRLTKGRRILDIGCGSGIFLDVAKEEGYDCYGVEISKLFYRIAQKNHKVFNKPLERWPGCVEIF